MALGGRQWLFSSCCGSRTPSDAYEPLTSNVTPHLEAVGALRVIIQAANIRESGFKPRPFVRPFIPGRTGMGTKTLETKTDSPNWISESGYLVVYSLRDRLEFEVMVHHRIRKPSLIGYATLQLSALEDDPTKVGIECPIIKHGTRLNGSLLFDVFFYPSSSVIDKKPSSLSNAGIVTLQLHEGKSFFSPKPCRLIAVVSLGWSEAPIHRTVPSVFNAPSWNSSLDFVCFDKASTVLVVKIIDENDYKKPTVHGHISLSLGELIEAQAEGREWWPLSGCHDAQLRMTAGWKSIETD